MSTPSTRSTIWAAAGETTAPDAGAIATGFVAGAKPSRRKLNWLLGWLDNAVQWLMAWGVAVYKNDVDYAANARVIFGVDGHTYKAKAANGPSTTIALPSDATKWERWGHADADIGKVTSLTGLVTADTGTVSGAYLHETVGRKEISFILAPADYTHLAMAVTFTGAAFTALNGAAAVYPHATRVSTESAAVGVYIGTSSGGETSKTITVQLNTMGAGVTTSANVTIVMYYT